MLMLLAAKPGVDFNDGYCDFVYDISNLPDYSILCSRDELDAGKIDIFHSHIDRTLRIYPGFIAQFGYTWRKPNGVGVVVLSFKELNDPDLFPEAKKEKEKALARYFPKLEMLYITPEALTKDSLSVPHEIAHLINYRIGIRDEELDEQIAYEFEEYYQ